MNAAHPEACPEIVELAGMLGLGLSPEAEKLLIHTDQTVEQILTWVEGCPTCTANLETLEAWQEEVGYPDFAIVAHERDRAHELWAKLENVPTEEIADHVGEEHCFWAMCQLLTKRALSLVLNSANRAAEFAQVATVIAAVLEEEKYTPALVSDLRSRAWSGLGNALRVRGEFGKADAAFVTALSSLRKGTLSTFTLAVYFDLLGSLRRDQRRLEESSQALEKAASLYNASGRPDLVAQALINSSTVEYLRSDRIAAIHFLTEAQELVDPLQDPTLFASCQHNLILYLTESESYLEASLRIPMVRRSWEQLGNHKNLAHLRWLEGRIHQASGEFEESERAYSEALDFFLSNKTESIAAFVRLDLACLSAEKEDHAGVVKQATESLMLFRRNSHKTEAFVAYAFLLSAAKAQAASALVVRKVSSFLSELSRSPDLKFDSFKT